MSAHQLAQGVASLGRGDESMLVHMEPREVAGLQALAMQHGGTLTTNPETGLPEAGWFGDILGAVAPIAMGALLGPGGIAGAEGLFGMGALGAGLATGLTGFALSGGDLGKGVMAGLGGYGGAGLGESLGKFGTITPTTSVDTITRSGVANASSIPGTTGASMFTEGAKDIAASQVPYTGFTGTTGELGANMGFNPANVVGTTQAASTNIPAIQQTWGDKMAAGASKAIQHPVDFFKSGNGMMNAFTLASPLMAIQPDVPKAPEDTSYKMKYEGPYTAQDRQPRMPTPEEMTRLAAQGSPEYSYFGNTNPYPGFNKAPGYAQGGVADLYASPDGTPAQNTPATAYGLGRLNNLSSAASTEEAKGMGFDAGGVVPMGAQASTPSGLSNLLGNAITDPMGRTVQSQPTLHAAGGGLRDGGFVVPADVVSHLGNGSTDAGLALLQKRHGAQSIRGAGDGMSDSIKTTIEGKQPARVADGEAYIPPEEVKRSGGSKKWYDKMDKIRKARTGTTKQGKQINPNSFLPV